MEKAYVDGLLCSVVAARCCVAARTKNGELLIEILVDEWEEGDRWKDDVFNEGGDDCCER